MWPARILVCFLLSSVAATASAADKTAPDYLRNKHAGMTTLSATKTVAELYPVLLKAAQECHVSRIAPGAGTGATSGALAGMSSASREVSGKISSDGRSAYIAVTVVGFFGAVRSNFLQIDMEDRENGVSIVVFHKNNVKAQREFIEEVRHWLDGDLAFCKPQPFMVKQTQKSGE